MNMSHSSEFRPAERRSARATYRRLYRQFEKTCQVARHEPLKSRTPSDEKSAGSRARREEIKSAGENEVEVGEPEITEKAGRPGAAIPVSFSAWLNQETFEIGLPNQTRVSKRAHRGAGFRRNQVRRSHLDPFVLGHPKNAPASSQTRASAH